MQGYFLEDFHEMYKCKCGTDVHIMQRAIMWIYCSNCGRRIVNDGAWFQDPANNYVWTRK